MDDQQPVDFRDDVEPDPGDLVAPAANRFRRRVAATTAVVAVVALAAGMALSPSALSRGGAEFGKSHDVGEAFYLGLAGMVTAPVHLLWVQPVASDGLDAEVQVCRDESPDLAVGLVPEDEVGEFCTQLDPVAGGTRVDPLPPHGTGNEYLVVRLVPTAEGHHSFCGLRVLYRSGLKIGFRHSTYMVGAIDAPRLPDGEFVDDETPRDPC